jgi:hypothetical protein
MQVPDFRNRFLLSRVVRSPMYSQIVTLLPNQETRYRENDRGDQQMNLWYRFVLQTSLCTQSVSFLVLCSPKFQQRIYTIITLSFILRQINSVPTYIPSFCNHLASYTSGSNETSSIGVSGQEIRIYLQFIPCVLRSAHLFRNIICTPTKSILLNFPIENSD